MLAIYGTLSLGAVDIAFSMTRFLIVQLTRVGDFRSITTIGMIYSLYLLLSTTLLVLEVSNETSSDLAGIFSGFGKSLDSVST